MPAGKRLPPTTIKCPCVTVRERGNGTGITLWEVPVVLKVLTQLWKDDCGALEAIEFILTASILVFGLVVGLTALRNAITTELEELGNAILAVNNSFSVGGLSGCCSSVQGSQAIQTTTNLLTPHVCTAPIPALIDVVPCP